MRNRIIEHSHRLPLERYRGEIAVSFTACTLQRKIAFIDIEIVQPQISFLERIAAKHQLAVLIYCFMPDHLHVVFRGLTADSNLHQAMCDFKQFSTHWFRSNESLYRWQKDFHDHILRTDDEVTEHIRYIANNPVRKGLVECWSDYPHTGAIGEDINDIMEGAMY